MYSVLVDKDGIFWDCNHPDFEGTLLKKSNWIGKWHQRWFILKGAVLFYGFDRESTPYGIVKLADLAQPISYDGLDIILTLSSQKTLTLRAESESAGFMWKSALETAVSKYCYLSAH
jgi:hypothetical protein